MNYIKGNLFAYAGTGVIIHGCNNQGVMGAGFALALKNRFPAAFKKYVSDWKPNKVCMGKSSIYVVDEHLTIFSAITQDIFGNDKSVRYVSYDAIDDAFKELFTRPENNKNTLFHMPQIGAGLGNGSWEVISSMINNRVYEHNINPDNVLVYTL